jgi:hypothetical protein
MLQWQTKAFTLPYLEMGWRKARRMRRFPEWERVCGLYEVGVSWERQISFRALMEVTTNMLTKGYKLGLKGLAFCSGRNRSGPCSIM